MIILEEDANLQGTHCRVSWEVFQNLMRGTEMCLLGPDEYIHAVRFEGEVGILVTIRNKEGTQYEDALY